MTTIISLLRVALSCLLLGALSAPAAAQIGGGSIVGNVTDQTGAAVPSATVKAVNIGTNAANTAVTNEQGYYEFPLLAPGQYVIEVTAAGFEARRSNEFALNTGARPRLDFALGAGEVKESVAITGEAPLINATNTELGVVIEQRKVQNLPLNGRNFQSLLALQPGVVNTPPSTVGGRGGIEFNGASAFGNNLTLDGVDISFGEHNGAGQSSGLSGFAYINAVSVDAIQEIKTSSSAFSAEYGRATGGVVVLTTKSGTNDYHGTLFEFLRNDAFDANSFDNNRRLVNGAATPKNKLRFNQFGGNLGGPLPLPRFGEGGAPVVGGKDRLFFFFNYEGVRQSGVQIVQQNVPTAMLINAVSPALRQHFVGLPTECSNPPTAANPFVCLSRRSAPRTTNENTYLSRVDYLWDKHRTSVRYNYLKQDFVNPQPRFDNVQAFPTRIHNAVIQDNWTIAPAVLNELRVGYNRFFLDRANTTIDTQPAFISVTGLFDSDFQSRLRSVSNTYMLNDNVTVIAGRQTFKFGAEIRYVRNARVQDTNPTHFYNSVNDLIADRPSSIRVVFGSGKTYDSWQTGYYLQDDIRVSKQLQINLGLRYEYYTPLRGGFNIATSDFFGPFNPKTEPMWNPDRNNFAPRAGLVYDVKGDQKLVVRAGAGVSYLPQQAFYYYDFAFVNPSFPFNAQFAPTDFPAGTNTAFPFSRTFIGNIIASGTLPRGLVTGRSAVDPNRRDEYNILYNTAVQYAVTRSLAVQAAYSGSHGVNEIVTTFQNGNVPGTTTRIRPDIGVITYITAQGRHKYNSLQLSANYRASNRGSLDFYYTLAKNISYGTSDSTEGPRNLDLQDFQNLAGSIGPKIGDVRHRVVGVGAYELPVPGFAQSNGLLRQLLGGYSLQGIYNWRSGQVLNINTGSLNLARNGVPAPIAQRPDLVLNQSLYLDNGPLPASNPFLLRTFINPAAFDLITPYVQQRYGTAPYNAVYGPRAWGFDASLLKNFRITERHNLQFRAEFFNAFNHANENNPDTNIYSGQLVNGLPTINTNFGAIGGKSGNRNIQFGLKYLF